MCQAALACPLRRRAAAARQVCDGLGSAATEVQRQLLTLATRSLWRPEGRLVQKRKAALLAGPQDGVASKRVCRDVRE